MDKGLKMFADIIGSYSKECVLLSDTIAKALQIEERTAHHRRLWDEFKDRGETYRGHYPDKIFYISNDKKFINRDSDEVTIDPVAVWWCPPKMDIVFENKDGKKWGMRSNEAVYKHGLFLSLLGIET